METGVGANVGTNNFELFGSYILLKKLAEGGMAEVFLARPASQDGNGRVLVVKRILPHIASHSVFLRMFQREIRLIMGFNHPHTVQLHDFGTANQQPYIAMEFIEGKNLREVMTKYLAKKQKIPIPMIVSLMAQAAAGLNYAHTFVNKVTGEELNAIHRDLSPHNLLVSYDGNLKVIDFGIAKVASSIHEMTQTGVVKGKAAYFSPEQITGQEVDARTDIFALGIIMWELLTGQRLFAKQGDTEVTAMQRISNCEQHVVPPSTLDGEIPPEIDAIVMKALKKNPDERFVSAREMQVALRHVMLQHYPDYSYADVAEAMNAMFAEEIIAERVQIRELNLQAQRTLIGNLDDKTMTTSMARGFPTTPSAVSMNTTMQAMSAADMLSNGTGVGIMDFRLSKIEQALKQKATTRHWVLFAFYVVALFGLKLSENFNFNVDITAQHAAMAAPMPVQAPPVAVHPQTVHPAHNVTARPVQPAVQYHPQTGAQAPRTAGTTVNNAPAARGYPQQYQPTQAARPQYAQPAKQQVQRRTASTVQKGKKQNARKR